jgi:hypothetical protein
LKALADKSVLLVLQALQQITVVLALHDVTQSGGFCMTLLALL